MTAEMTYGERIERLRETKVRQTREKLERLGYMDHDDHGFVAPPADFRWTPTPNHPSGAWFGPDGWARNFRSLLEVHPTYVDPVDALAGRWMAYMTNHRKLGWPPEHDYADLRPEQERYGIIPGIGALQHFGPDYRKGLAQGWGGLLEEVRRSRAALGPEHAEFLEAAEQVVLALQTWIRRHVPAIRQAEAAEVRPELRRSLARMAEANAWIVDGAPRTLLEACQWIAWYQSAARIYNGEGAGTQLDEVLRPYYERDREAGLVDDEAAIFTVACLLLNDTHYHQIGGPGPDGRDLTSPMSHLILEAAHRLGIPCNLTIRVHDGLDPQLFATSVRHLLHDRKGWPRYSGDRGLTEGFMRSGYSSELARERICVGCHWMAIPGREYTLNDCVKINVARVFEVALWEAVAGSGECSEARVQRRDREGADPVSQPSTLNPQLSVASLWQCFDEHLQRAVLCTARGLDFHLAHQKDNAPELVLNLLCHGPIEKGRDISEVGTVEFYNLCVDGSGLATAADSFGALEQRIEREGVLTWEEVLEALRDDFAGTAGERIRLMLKTAGRYGHGGTLGDAWAVRISRRFSDLVAARPTPGGRKMIPGWFSWSNTIGMGKVVGATPNGRHAGAPISHGANPDPGFRKDGAPTAMAEAIAAIQPGYGNTAPIQLELDPGIARDEAAVQKVAALIKGHCDQGGTLFNINILDADTLRRAHKDPAAYPDLVVRVTGFTAYFATLSPEFRQLVVDRLIEE